MLDTVYAYMTMYNAREYQEVKGGRVYEAPKRVK